MKISAIITTYKRPEWLREAIESVVTQSRPLDEILVVDAGTAEETKTVTASFGSRVRYLQMEDHGLGAARNFGMRHAAGDWVAFLDDDDQWLPDKIRLQELAVQRSAGAVLVYTSKVMSFPDATTEIVAAPERFWPALRFKNVITPSSAMVQKAVVLEVGGFNESLRNCEDWDLWVRLAVRHRFTVVLEPVTKYRVSAGQMSTSIDLLLSNTEQILEGSLLLGLTGIRRSFWRRRIRAAQLFSAAVLARDDGSPKAREFVKRSLLQWPSPTLLPRRFLFLILELVKAV